MTALDLLRERGPMSALDLALELGLPESHLVYVELVAAESRGEVRVLPEWRGHKPEPHKWEAM